MVTGAAPAALRENPTRLLVTLCRGCHARVHRLAVLRFWLPPFVVVLWQEQHPGVPRQLQFDLAGTAYRVEDSTELAVAPRSAVVLPDLHAIRALVLDSVPSPYSRRAYGQALDHFLGWYAEQPRGPLRRALVRNEFGSDVRRQCALAHRLPGTETSTSPSP